MCAEKSIFWPSMVRSTSRSSRRCSRSAGVKTGASLSPAGRTTSGAAAAGVAAPPPRTFCTAVFTTCQMNR